MGSNQATVCQFRKRGATESEDIERLIKLAAKSRRAARLELLSYGVPEEQVEHQVIALRRLYRWSREVSLTVGYVSGLYTAGRGP